MIATVPAIKLALLAALSYPGLAKLWRNLSRSRHPMTALDRRLATLWHWQAFGLLLAAVPIASVWVMMSFVDTSRVPFWTIYAIIIVVGAGALVFAHAKGIEARLRTTEPSDRHGPKGRGGDAAA